MEDSEYALMQRAEQRMWWYRAAHALLMDLYMARIAGGAGPVVDAGCGTGGLLGKLSAIDPSRPLIGLDYHPLACHMAHDLHKAMVVTGSINQLPFADRSVDAILSVDVLSHRSVDEKAALAGVVRCLKSGGMLILNLPAYDWMMSIHDRRVYNGRRYTRRSITRLLQDAGFTSINASYWNSLLFPLMVIRRKILPLPGDVSDVMEYNPCVDGLFFAVTRLERHLRRIGLVFPFGGSVLVAATLSS